MACCNNFNDFRELLLSEHSSAPPIKILAEGDSWFAYPRRYVAWGEAANLLQILGESTEFAIFGQPRNGDEIAQMLAPPQEDDLAERRSEIPCDILFFSGGSSTSCSRSGRGTGAYEHQDAVRRPVTSQERACPRMKVAAGSFAGKPAPAWASYPGISVGAGHARDPNPGINLRNGMPARSPNQSN